METSEEAKRALRSAEAKLALRKEEQAFRGMPVRSEVTIAGNLAPIQIKESLINRRLGRKQLELDAPPPDEKGSKYYDSRMSERRSEREKRKFNFVTPGSFVRQGQTLRAELYTKQKGFDENDPLHQRLFATLRGEPVPPVEWWDRALLPSANSYDLEKIAFSGITHYVEHPVPEKKPSQDTGASAASFLTKDERKKLRRIRREEVQKEKQVKVMLGIEKPEEARATLTNMTRVYGSLAFEDPTKVDQMVRQQMKARLDKHTQANEERKLTPEQRREKKLEKLRRNESGEVEVVVFKISDLSSPLHRKNIDHAARDGALSGVLIITPPGEGACSLLVAEGAPRAIS